MLTKLCVRIANASFGMKDGLSETVGLRKILLVYRHRRRLVMFYGGSLATHNSSFIVFIQGVRARPITPT